MAELDFCDGSDGDGSASKDLDLGCHRFMADGLGGRNRHHGILLSTIFRSYTFGSCDVSFGPDFDSGLMTGN